MKNAFYFILKAPFVLKLFECLPWLFDHVEKKGLIRKIRLISKFMTSQTGSQANTIHILANISRSKGNETMKFDQVIVYRNRKSFFKNHTKKEARRLLRDIILFFKKVLYIKKQVVCSLVSIYFDSAQLSIQ